MKPELLDIFCLKTELWESRVDQLIAKKSFPWTKMELQKVLKRLNNNKTRDPNSMVNELFKQDCAGEDVCGLSTVSKSFG